VVNVALDISGNMDLLDSHAHSGTTERVYTVETLTSAAIQTQIDAANAAGGGTVYCPPGTYVGTLLQTPGQTSVASCIWMRSNVKLKFSKGAVLQLAASSTLPGATTQGHIISTYLPYATSTANAKSNVVLEDVEVDGNANNQAGVQSIYHGIFVGSTRSAWVVRCKAKNVYGTGDAPPTETMHFECNDSRDVHYIDCEADGSGGTNTSTGFSTNNSFGVSWTGCSAHDLAHGMGFTNWQSAGLRYADCHAYSCGATGFNAERGEGITYSSCVSGSRSPDTGSDAAFPWYADSTDLGNNRGFSITGCKDVSGASCVSAYNTADGIKVGSNSGVSPTRACDTVVFASHVFLNNGTNVAIDSGQAGVWVGPAATSGGDVIDNHGTAPLIAYTAANGSSGVRWAVNGYGSEAYRWLTNNLTALRVAGGTPPVGGDSNATGRAGDVTATWNLRGESIGTQVKSGSGILTVADTDFAHQPSDGAIAFARDTTTGLLYRVVRIGGAWLPFPEVDPNVLTLGESSIFPRELASGTITMSSGNLRLRYFTAKKTETITQVRLQSVGAAGATPTLVRVGIWTADQAGGLLSLVANTTNDTALLAGATTIYTKALASSWGKVDGQRYAAGLLVVTTFTAPTVIGHGLDGTQLSYSPRISGIVSAQTDLPASLVAGSVGNSGTTAQIEMLP
jgi:hypothetical protein